MTFDTTLLEPGVQGFPQCTEMVKKKGLEKNSVVTAQGEALKGRQRKLGNRNVQGGGFTEMI